MKIISIKVEFLPGDDIKLTCRQAVGLAAHHSAVVEFSFNGTHFNVRAHDTADLLVKAYREKAAPIGDPA